MELKERDILMIDCETTGFDEDKHQILEVGMLVIRNNEVVADMEVKIKHKEYVLSIQAMKANKIDLIEHDDIGLNTKEACEKILEFLANNKIQEDGFIVLGQNVSFDIKFIEKLFLKEYKIKEFRQLVSYRNIDIMQLALLRNLENKIRLEKQSLDYILDELKIEIPGDRHRALTDCYLQFKVYKKLLEL